MNNDNAASIAVSNADGIAPDHPHAPGTRLLKIFSSRNRLPDWDSPFGDRWK